MPNFQDLGSNAEDKNLEAQVSCGFGDGYIFDAQKTVIDNSPPNFEPILKECLRAQFEATEIALRAGAYL